MNSSLWAILIGGGLATTTILLSHIGPALADRIRYGRLPKPDDK